jgi:CHAT domain-containing protein
LAVLSGCGSGRNYASTVATCPSLGEALVDAGVRAAVHTDVDVRDGDAETSMVEFLDVWRGDPDPVHALTVAQRRAHRAGRAPAVWAAYAITLGSLVDRSRAHDTGVAAPGLLSGGPMARRPGSDDD